MQITLWLRRILLGKDPARTLVRAAITAAVLIVVFKVMFVPIRVRGNSMEPGYRNGRINIVSRIAYWYGAPKRGDVVEVRREGSIMVMLKRVVGVPGERVAVRQGQVWINGEPLNESYARGDEIPSTSEEKQLGPEEFFVIGDNRDVTAYGIVKKSEIRGRVLF